MSTNSVSVTVDKDSTVTAVLASMTTVAYGNESASTFTATVTASNRETVPSGDTITVNVGSDNCTVTLPGAS